MSCKAQLGGIVCGGGGKSRITIRVSHQCFAYPIHKLFSSGFGAIVLYSLSTVGECALAKT